jgi:DNA repair photolyase
MKERVEVGFTITTFSDKAQQFFEPHSSLVKDRIAALRRLNRAGVDTWVFIAPILPYATEDQLEDGLSRLADAGVKRVMTDRYNARGMIINQTLKAYEFWKPSTNLEEIRELLWNGYKYYDKLDARISSIWKKEAPSAIHEKVF